MKKKRTWTEETALMYVLRNEGNPARGLKYCSAVDYLLNHTKHTRIPTCAEYYGNL